MLKLTKDRIVLLIGVALCLACVYWQYWPSD
jgi:hypothetical protein